MTEAPADVPVVFGPQPGLFGVLTLPGVGQRNHGVVICAPFGHANVCSYRPLRTLARRLAEDGWPVLRFDWPGTGDSGDPAVADGSWLETWVDAVRRGVDELCSRAAVEAVALVGLRVGGTLALAAAEHNRRVTGLALLAPYASGRAYLRDLRAFERIGQSLFSEPEIPPPPLPEGSLESSGFLVSRAEVAALERLDLSARDASPLSGNRVLVATPSSDRTVDALANRFAEAGAEVTRRTLPELLLAWEGTSTCVMTRRTSRLVCDWLAAGDAPVATHRAYMP